MLARITVKVSDMDCNSIKALCCTKMWVTGLIVAGFACGTIAYGAYNSLQIKELKKNIDALQESVSIQKGNSHRQATERYNDYNSFSQKLHNQENTADQILKRLNAAQTEIRDLKENIQGENPAVRDFQASLKAQAQKNQELYEKTQYSFDVLARSSLYSALTSEDASAKAFSYYQGNEWWDKTAHFLSQDNVVFGVNKALKVGMDETGQFVSVSQSGTFIIDGFFYRGMNNYKLSNNLENMIFVTAPGLAVMGSDILIVRGDKDLDSVVLDGCLEWTNQDDADGFSHWQVKDKDGAIKTVKISMGTPVHAERVCDANYFEKEVYNSLAKFWRESHSTDAITISREVLHRAAGQESTFGGIGIKLRKTDEGLHVKEVIPGLPAEKGGLYPGDIIVKIGGVSVSGMSYTQAVEAIRGQSGTSVTLSYSPAGSVSVIKDVTLVRETIQIQE